MLLELAPRDDPDSARRRAPAASVAHCVRILRWRERQQLERPVVALVPCHRDDGTNVLSVPTSADFVFAYGPGSFQRHLAEADRLGLEARIVRDPDLMVDVDVPDDLPFLNPSRATR